MSWISLTKRVLALPALALAGAYIIMVVWTQLIRHEYVENATFAWFPMVAIVWACLCFLGGAFLIRPAKTKVK